MDLTRPNVLAARVAFKLDGYVLASQDSFFLRDIPLHFLSKASVDESMAALDKVYSLLILQTVLQRLGSPLEDLLVESSTMKTN